MKGVHVKDYSIATERQNIMKIKLENVIFHTQTKERHYT